MEASCGDEVGKGRRRMTEPIEKNGHRDPRGPALALADAEDGVRPVAGATRVAIGIQALGFHQEVQDFLGRDPRLDIVGAAADAERLVAIMSERSPDVVLACPSVARELRHPTLGERRPPLVMVVEEMTVPVLREAIDLGAEFVFAWPEERGELARTVAGLGGRRTEPGGVRGKVLAVLAARGGAGATFVATHLAAALAAQDARSVLVDAAVALGDASAALGIEAGSGRRTVLDLVPVMNELTPSHVEDALFHHPGGFSALLAPTDPGRASEVPPALVCATVALLAASNEWVVVLLPRSGGPGARATVAMADLVLLVTTLDLFSLYGARRAIESFGSEVQPDAWRIVLNRPSRPSLGTKDARRVLRVAPFVSIGSDGRVRRAQERGELLRRWTSGAGRDIRTLARRLVAEGGAGAGAGVR
jgi:pilus assembly protein CpaE